MEVTIVYYRMRWVPIIYIPPTARAGYTPLVSESNALKNKCKKIFLFHRKKILCSTNNLILSLKLMTMKSILLYLFATLMLGSFTGLLMSFGSHILPCIGFMSLFWGCMLMPMLGDAK